MSVPADPNEEDLFSHALGLPEAERAAYLAKACGSDAALRSRIEALLRASEAAPQFMEAPAIPPSVPRPGEVVVGDRIGRYKLLQQIGEGGCGAVYMAGQEEPVRRRVALKVIKLGMDTKEVIARFEAERQALALMDHPNIARVFDGGATDTGRPYFVMELVRGVPITKFCDEHNFPTEKRLELFTQVCHAVQHAHQKGIIHRDLKPSNILVTVNDAEPVPKVIDFGIAKATQGRLTDQTLFTAFEQFIGTPAYMSPEQAEMTSLDVDTRSDIYSLGVLLYELLMGRAPFDPKTLIAAGFDEVRRIIREVDPPRPSTRLSTLTDVDRATIAKQRGLEPAQLSKLLSGDLDWIVMRCLEKDRRRRYETANGLALDVKRYLRDEPVLARPPGNIYRFQKLVRRNKAVFGATAGALAALLAGTVISIAQAVRAARAENAANEEASVSRAVSDFLTEDFLTQVGAKKQAEFGYTPNPRLTVREALDRAAGSVSDRFKRQPLAEAAVRTAIARAYMELGENRLALPHIERAFAVHKDLLGDENPVTLTTMHKLANALWGDRKDAGGV
jgi:serine/threonine protein kinase